MPAAGWRELLVSQGALVEAWLSGGEELSSPSVQGMIHPGGEVEVLSTHEQLLGGPGGQTIWAASSRLVITTGVNCSGGAWPWG